jgi:hypothetical protein
MLVNIRILTRNNQHKNPLAPKEFRLFQFSRLCLILYIFDKSTFLASEEAHRQHKKVGFYVILIEYKKQHKGIFKWFD